MASFKSLISCRENELGPNLFFIILIGFLAYFLQFYPLFFSFFFVFDTAEHKMDVTFPRWQHGVPNRRLDVLQKGHNLGESTAHFYIWLVTGIEV